MKLKLFFIILLYFYFISISQIAKAELAIPNPRENSAPVNFSVNSCNGTPLNMTFTIDCSHLDSVGVANCLPFITHVACQFYPAYQAITQVNLSGKCPVLYYTIYNDHALPSDLEDAGGRTDGARCQIDYRQSMSVGSARESSDPTHYPSDSHELLHAFQYGLLLPDSHSLFSASQLEARRLIGDPSYEAEFHTMSLNTSYYLNPPPPSNMDVPSPPPITTCVQAQNVIEGALYINNPQSIYQLYFPFILNSSLDSVDPSQNPSRLMSEKMYEVSGYNESYRQYLNNHACPSISIQLPQIPKIKELNEKLLIAPKPYPELKKAFQVPISQPGFFDKIINFFKK